MAQMRAPIQIDARNQDLPQFGSDMLRTGTQMGALQQEFANRAALAAAETEAKRQMLERGYEVEDQQLDKRLANATKIAGMRNSGGGGSTNENGEYLNASGFNNLAMRVGEENALQMYESVLKGKNGTTVIYRRKAPLPQQPPVQPNDRVAPPTMVPQATPNVVSPAGAAPSVPMAPPAPPPTVPGTRIRVDANGKIIRE